MAWLSGFRTEEGDRRLAVNARQHLTRGDPESPDDEDNGQRMRDAEPSLPGSERAPYAGDRHGRRANEIEDELEPAGMRVRPDEHPDAQRETQTDAHPGRDPRPPARGTCRVHCHGAGGAAHRGTWGNG